MARADLIDPRLLILFAKVVEKGGISAASRALVMQKGTLSRAVSKLETLVGDKLLIRGSRRIRVTELGQVLLPYCQRIIQDMDDAQAAIGSLNGTVRGRLKISAPITFGRLLLSPMLPGFLEKYPDIRLELELTNRRVDPLEEGVDFVIRLSQQMEVDPSLVATELAVFRSALCASPRYLRRRGIPRTPSDLSEHSIIDTFHGAERKIWSFVRDGITQIVEVKARADLSDPVVRRDATAAGLGIALLPYLLIESHLRRKQLKVILPGWQSEIVTSVYALYPTQRSLTIKSRTLLAFLAQTIPRRDRPA
jgi:LysR family transcriptional regulator for bpeEF and oprC